MTERHGQPQPASWGVQTAYVDATGVRRRVGRDAVQRALASMGAESPRPPIAGPVFARPGERLPAGAASVLAEDGSEEGLAARSGRLPRLPRVRAGYHTLRMRSVW